MTKEIEISELDFLKQFAALYEQLHETVHGKKTESLSVEAVRLEAVGKLRDFRAEVDELFEASIAEVVE